MSSWYNIPIVMKFPDVEEIRTLRTQLGLSQQDLAEAVGVSQSAITKYENGTQVPSYKIGSKIFEILLKENDKESPVLSSLYEPSIITADQDMKIGKANKIMKKHSISQIPVIEDNKVIGTFKEAKAIDLMEEFGTIDQIKNEKVKNHMDEPLPIVPLSAKLSDVSNLLKTYRGILLSDHGNICGILTMADLLDL